MNSRIPFNIFAGLLILFLFFPGTVSAGWWDAIANPDQFVGELLVTGLSTLLSIIGRGIAWAAGLLDQLISFTGSSYPAEVQSAWKMVLNFVNMFFILILVVTAFGTVFNVSKWTWKEILGPVLLVALVINFSYTIGVFIVDIANGIAQSFSGVMQGASLRIADGLGIANIGQVNLGAKGSSTALPVIFTAIFFVIYLGIAFFAFVGAALFLLIRTPILWFLLILSPLAWIGYTLPSLRTQTWDRWWRYFIGWAFFLPVFLFFLMFASILINAKGKLGGPLASPAVTAATNENGQTASLEGRIGGGVELAQNTTGATTIAQNQPEGIPLAQPASDVGILSALGVNELLFYGMTLIVIFGGLGLSFATMSWVGSKAGKGLSMLGSGLKKVGRFAPGYQRAVDTARGVKQGLQVVKEGQIEKGFGFGRFRIGGEQQSRLRQAKWAARFGDAGAKDKQFMEEVDKDKKGLKDISDIEELKKIASSKSGRKATERMAAREVLKDRNMLTGAQQIQTFDLYGGDETAAGLRFAKGMDYGKFSKEERRLMYARVKDIELKKKIAESMADRKDLKDATPEDLKKFADLFALGGDKKGFLDKVKKYNFQNTVQAMIDLGLETEKELDKVMAKEIKKMKVDDILELSPENLKKFTENKEMRAALKSRFNKEAISNIASRATQEQLESLEEVVQERAKELEEQEKKKSGSMTDTVAKLNESINQLLNKDKPWLPPGSR